MTSVQGRGRRVPAIAGWGGIVLGCAAWLLAGCAAVPQQIATPSESEMAWVLSGADRLKGEPPPGQVEDLAALMRVTPEMHRFAEAVQTS